MILLDTHIWVWWVDGNENLSIAIESTRLPGVFHRDPADQIIVATARIYDCLLITTDERITNYPHVKTL